MVVFLSTPTARKQGLGEYIMLWFPPELLEWFIDIGVFWGPRVLIPCTVFPEDLPFPPPPRLDTCHWTDDMSLLRRPI